MNSRNSFKIQSIPGSNSLSLSLSAVNISAGRISSYMAGSFRSTYLTNQNKSQKRKKRRVEKKSECWMKLNSVRDRIENVRRMVVKPEGNGSSATVFAEENTAAASPRHKSSSAKVLLKEERSKYTYSITFQTIMFQSFFKPPVPIVQIVMQSENFSSFLARSMEDELQEFILSIFASLPSPRIEYIVYHIFHYFSKVVMKFQLENK